MRLLEVLTVLKISSTLQDFPQSGLFMEDPNLGDKESSESGISEGDDDEEEETSVDGEPGNSKVKQVYIVFV